MNVQKMDDDNKIFYIVSLKHLDRYLKTLQIDEVWSPVKSTGRWMQMVVNEIDKRRCPILKGFRGSVLKKSIKIRTEKNSQKIRLFY